VLKVLAEPVADAFGDLGEPDVVAAKEILRDGHAPSEQVFHRRQATVCVKRSKNAERESAAVFASWVTVHVYLSLPRSDGDSKCKEHDGRSSAH
jgi:hypothetical protein